MDYFEVVLPEQSNIDLVRELNGLIARYNKDYDLTSIYIYEGKGKVIFTQKEKRTA